MSSWDVQYLDESRKELRELDGSQKLLVRKAIAKVSQNPLPNNEGGYGKPLGGKLKGFMKIKLRAAGIRITYRIVKSETQMLVVVIGLREDDEVYRLTLERAEKYDLLQPDQD